VERISSRQNPVVKRFRAVALSSPSSGDVLLDGEHLLEEALASNMAIDVAVFAERHLDNSSGHLAGLARRIGATGARVVAVADDVLAAMSPVREPSGAVAIARVRSADLESVFAKADEQPLVVVLAGLQDPGNVGAIVRSGLAFGATAVVTTEGTASPFGWKALRGAMGATFRVPVAASFPLQEIISAAHAARVPLVATMPRGGTPLPDVKLRRACAVAFGAEGTGLPDAAIVAADVTISIPVRGPVESLNVATAASLVLYEASRQRADRR
jgi:TrmH family RNA methyltransferase